MKSVKWMIVPVLFLICLPVHAQFGGPLISPYDQAINRSHSMMDWMIAFSNSGNSSSSAQGNTSYIVPGGTSNLPPLKIAVTQHKVLPSVAILPDEHALFCATGTVLSIGGKLPEGSYLPPALEVNRRRVDSDAIARITGDYLFYWTAAEAGDYVLRVMFTARDGDLPMTLRTIHVNVNDTAPVSLKAVPASCDNDVQASVTRTSTAVFKAARSEIVMNSGSFTLPDDQSVVAIPASKMPPGDYSFSVTSYAADGIRYVSMPEVVRVQHSIALTGQKPIDQTNLQNFPPPPSVQN